jgi:hypothetical protein
MSITGKRIYRLHFSAFRFHVSLSALPYSHAREAGTIVKRCSFRFIREHGEDQTVNLELYNAVSI